MEDIKKIKEKKKEWKEKFLQNNKGKNIKKKLKGPKICGVLCILFSFYIIIDNYINKISNWDYIYGACIFICGLFFVLLSHSIFNKKLQSFIINKK